MVDKLDREHRHRIQPFAFGPFPRFALLCLAILIGAASNIAWNTLTHEYGWAVQNIDALRQTIGGSDLPLYVLLHHISTLLGLAVLLFVAFYHRHWAWPSVVAHWPLLFVIGWITVAGGIALGMLVAGDVSNAEGLMRWVGSGLVVATLVMLLVTTFLCLVWHIRHRLTRGRKG